MYKLGSVKLWVSVVAVALVTVAFFWGLENPTEGMWVAYLGFVGGALGVYTAGNVASKFRRPDRRGQANGMDT